MIISVSAALLLALLVYLLWRYARLPLWQITLCALLGYLLASSSLGPHIGNALRTFAQFVSGLHV